MAITPQQARQELARRELARRGIQVNQPAPQSEFGPEAAEREIANRHSSIKEVGNLSTLQDTGGSISALAERYKTERPSEKIAGALGEMVRGGMANLAFKLQQPERSFRADMEATLQGERPAQLGDVARASDVPIVRSSPVRFLVNNADFLLPGALSARKAGMDVALRDIPKLPGKAMEAGREAGAFISKGLERFGLKQPKQFPVNPSVDDLARMSPQDRAMYKLEQERVLRSQPNLESFPVNPSADDLAKIAPEDRRLYLESAESGIKNRFAQKEQLARTLQEPKMPGSFPANPSLDDLVKMPAEDRQLYMQIQKNKIQSKYTEQLTREQEILRSHGEKLASQIESASREAVLKARPAYSQVMGKASPTWKKLIQEGLDEADDVPVPHIEIQEELSKKFGGDPAMVNRALQEINVNVPSRTSIDPLMGTQVQPYSAKEVWSRLNQQRLDIPAGKRAGDAIYGEREFFKDSVIEALANILHRRGVNLSRANQFWAPYAQLRNSIFKQVKPFITEPYQLETGQRLFKSAAQGKGKVAEVADLEARTGQDYTSQLRDLTARESETQSKLKSLPKQIQQQKSSELAALREKQILSQGKASELESLRKEGADRLKRKLREQEGQFLGDLTKKGLQAKQKSAESADLVERKILELRIKELQAEGKISDRRAKNALIGLGTGTAGGSLYLLDRLRKVLSGD